MPRPKRALTEVLTQVGREEIAVNNLGDPISREEVLARSLWDFVNEGSVKLLNGRVIEAGARDWKDAAQWIYHHVDGPAKADVQVDLGGLSEIERSTVDELQAMVAATMTPELLAEMGLTGDMEDTQDAEDQ